jgi:hypothetical protein
VNQINFEAIGRYHHAADCVSAMAVSRTVAAMEVRTLLDGVSSDKLSSFDVASLQAPLKRFDYFNERLQLAIDEQNKWAEVLGKPLIEPSRKVLTDADAAADLAGVPRPA